MIELLEYACPKYSSFGFQWVKIAELNDQEEADKAIEELINQGRKGNDFKTRVKIESVKNKSAANFIFKKKPVNLDLRHSERRKLWNSTDSRDKI